MAWNRNPEYSYSAWIGNINTISTEINHIEHSSILQWRSGWGESWLFLFCQSRHTHKHTYTSNLTPEDDIQADSPCLCWGMGEYQQDNDALSTAPPGNLHGRLIQKHLAWWLSLSNFALPWSSFPCVLYVLFHITSQRIICSTQTEVTNWWSKWLWFMIVLVYLQLIGAHEWFYLQAEP